MLGGVTVNDPLVGIAPVPPIFPDAVQELAFVLDHVIVVDSPSVIVEGFAEALTVGGGVCALA
ncbi:MAG TPA: hypothetical protein VMA75_04255 [Candidatus Paceibacterota bacterium]|nr:hypothetical protein [Candidatus Paceibacterota bacterium]